jgi:hypothetical protein
MKTKRTLVMGVMLLITQQLLPGAIQEAPKNPTALAAASEQDRNKAVARRVFDEILNQGKFEVAAEIYAPDFVNHGNTRNVDLRVDQAAVHQEKTAFPDLKMSVELMVAEFWTDTWLKREGKWQIVAAQDTILPCNP